MRSYKSETVETGLSTMNVFDSLYRFKSFGGVHRLGNVPFDKGMYILLVPDYGYVAVNVSGSDSEIFDPKGRVHPSIREYLKMCNVHSFRYNTMFYKQENEKRVSQFVTSKLNSAFLEA